MLSVIRKGNGKRRAVEPVDQRSTVSRSTSSAPVAIGVIATGMLAFVMAYGFATHPDSNEATSAIFSGIFTLIGICVVLGGLAWYRKSVRRS